MKIAMKTGNRKEISTVNDFHEPNMCSTLLFASQRISVVTDVFHRTRHVAELDNRSFRLLGSF